MAARRTGAAAAQMWSKASAKKEVDKLSILHYLMEDGLIEVELTKSRVSAVQLTSSEPAVHLKTSDDIKLNLMSKFAKDTKIKFHISKDLEKKCALKEVKNKKLGLSIATAIGLPVTILGFAEYAYKLAILMAKPESRDDLLKLRTPSDDVKDLTDTVKNMNTLLEQQSKLLAKLVAHEKGAAGEKAAEEKAGGEKEKAAEEKAGGEKEKDVEEEVAGEKAGGEKEKDDAEEDVVEEDDVEDDVE